MASLRTRAVRAVPRRIIVSRTALTLAAASAASVGLLGEPGHPRPPLTTAELTAGTAGVAGTGTPADARLTAPGAATSTGTGTGTGRAAPAAPRTPAPPEPPSAQAAQALAFAYRALGLPYAWGATGPDAYDCSGLTRAAWAAAGVALPRTSYLQVNAGPRVPAAELRPGDLVFFHPGLSHVGLCVGGGRMIHAPHPGAPVRVSPIADLPLTAATRPAP
jgi:cell wall-associated NlpC family hydrolase